MNFRLVDLEEEERDELGGANNITFNNEMM